MRERRKPNRSREVHQHGRGHQVPAFLLALGHVLLNPVERAPQVGAAIVEPPRGQELRLGDGRRPVVVVVFQREGRAGEGRLLAALEPQRFHAFALLGDRFEAVQHSNAPSMTWPTTSPLWGTRTSPTVSPQTMPF